MPTVTATKASPKAGPKTSPDYRKLELTIQAGMEEKKKKVAEAQEVLKEAEHEVGFRNFILEIFESMRHPRSDPGKYGAAYFCYTDGGLRAIPKELLSPANAKEAAKAGYQVVPWAKMRTVNCPRCSQQHPLVIEHHQTYDSPDGDTWMRRDMVICPLSEGAHVIKKETSESRLA